MRALRQRSQGAGCRVQGMHGRGYLCTCMRALRQRSQKSGSAASGRLCVWHSACVHAQRMELYATPVCLWRFWSAGSYWDGKARAQALGGQRGWAADALIGVLAGGHLDRVEPVHACGRCTREIACMREIATWIV